MARVGDYTLTYSISDPSVNVATLTRSIKVEDTKSPVVKLYGSKTMYVDLQAIESGGSRYYDPGAFAVENLYKKENGFVDWLVEDDDMLWSFAVVQCNDLANDTYPAVTESDSVPVNFLEEYIKSLASNPPTEVERYRFYYFLTDRVGNTGSNFRTVELRGSSNLYPSIDFILSSGYDGALNASPNDVGSTIDENNKLATLHPLTWTIQVGEQLLSDAPAARVYTDLGGGEENLDDNYTVDLYHIKSDNTEEHINSIHSGGVGNFPNHETFFSSVNYWIPPGKEPEESSFFSGSPGTYVEHERGTDGWREVVFRYSVTNSLGNKSERDMVVRLVDTEKPLITKNAFSGNIEVGESFLDPGVVVTDSAESVTTKTTTISLDHPQGLDHNATFAELEDNGFWTAGSFTITYNASDEFENNASSETLALNVVDTKKPHVAIIKHENFDTFHSDNEFATLDFADGEAPIVSQYDRLSEVFREGTDYGTGSISWSGFYDGDKFSSVSPYIQEDNGTGFYLKASEVNIPEGAGLETISNLPSTQFVKLNDDFGRTYAWLCPLKIDFISGSTFYDPGLLIYEPSNSDLSYTVTINRVKDISAEGSLSDQIREITISIRVSQTNPSISREINSFRTYTFLDDLKPLITVGPDTNSTTTYIVVEAGSDYSDDNGELYKISENGVINNSEQALSLSAYDVTDGDITENVQSTITDLNDSSTGSVSTAYDQLNHIYEIEYNVDDAEGNSADAKYRYLIIKDTTAPVLSLSGGVSTTLELGYSIANDIDFVKSKLLENVSVYDVSSINPDDFVWEVNITKPASDPDSNRSFEWNPDPGATQGIIYPADNTSSGYDVTITATDENGNTSTPFIRELKISDTTAPTITLIGDSTIHDFLRYSKNTGLDDNATGPRNTELLFADQPDSEEFNSSGFIGGAHRIILDNYTFVDPGAYAEDDNSFFSLYDDIPYPDKDGDGIGETWAFKRVDNRVDMENCEDVGVIYFYSELNKDDVSLSKYQYEMANDGLGPESNVSVPNLQAGGYDFNSSNKNLLTKLNVIYITNEYRVRDGWGNKSDIATRRIYIYESSQYPNFAFYATPLSTEQGGGDFENMYDNGSGEPFLNSTRKDTDGDGVSDFWELAFGTNPLDRSDRPDDDDLSSPEFYRGKDFNAINP